MSYSNNFSVRLFGPTLFHLDEEPLHIGLKGATLELLLYLAAHEGQQIRREQVADLLWRNSSTSRQRSALNSALWRIGKKLPDHPGLRLLTTDSTLCLSIGEDISFDMRTLETCVQEVATDMHMDETSAAHLARTIDHSGAPFLDGLSSDWTLAPRERLSNIRARGMIALMHHYGDTRNVEAALATGRQLLAEDPFRESVQIEVMFLYVMNGQRAHAIRHYEAFHAMLARELGIEPMVETRALFDLIRSGMSHEGLLERSAPEAGAGREWLTEVLAESERSRQELYRALRLQSC